MSSETDTRTLAKPKTRALIEADTLSIQLHARETLTIDAELVTAWEIDVASHGDGIVGMAVVVGVEEAYEPLEELEVVLELSLDETVDVQRLGDTTFIPVVLKELPVISDFVLGSCIPLDSSHEYGVGEDDVVEEAVGITGMELLNLGVGGPKHLVHPEESLLSRYVLESRGHHRFASHSE